MSECLYCYRKVAYDGPAPRTNDSSRWRDLAREHASWCEWIATRAHTAARCECGEWSGVACEWSGDESDLVSVDWMPEHLRASHEAAGTKSIRGLGRPAGVCRLNASEECAERILTESGDWAVRR